MVEWENDPALFRRRLRSELRRAREACEMSHRDVAVAMDWSVSKLIRIETGAVTIQTNDLRALLAHYGINDAPRVEALVDTAKKSRERSPWWTEFRDVASSELLSMCGFEASAKIIRNFEPLLVPGLLQTEEYARDLFQYLRGPKDERRVGGLTNLRLQRQEVILGDLSRSLHFILDEAVVRRVVGGAATMRKQLLRLRELAAQPNITIRIVPFDQGMYRGLRVPYVIFEYDDPQDETILYLENPQQEAVLLEDSAAAGEDEGVPTPTIYLEIFWELEQDTDPTRTGIILDEALEALHAEVDVRETSAAVPAEG